MKQENCAASEESVQCTLEMLGMWSNGGPTVALIMAASQMTGIDVSKPLTLASLTAEAVRIRAEGCMLAEICA